MSWSHTDIAAERRWARMRDDGDVIECDGVRCQHEVLALEAVGIGAERYCDSCADDILADRAHGLAMEAFGADSEVEVIERNSRCYVAEVTGAHLTRCIGLDRVDALQHLIAALRHEIAEQRRRGERRQ